MDKWQAIQSFWSGFGIPAYNSTSVPPDAQYPYITYEPSVASFENVISLPGKLWYRSTSLAAISQKVEEIARAVSPYKKIPVSGGYLFIVEGSPFAQDISGESDNIKGKYINVQAEFYTNY